MSNLSINPSYTSNEVVMDSCPPGSFTNYTTPEAAKFTRNYPLLHGNSVLGIYGADFMRFGIKTPPCFQCNGCENNAVTTLFYKPARQVLHHSYGLVYRGTDDLYRAYDK